MNGLPDVSSIIHRLYEFGPQPWERALSDLTDIFGADHATILGSSGPSSLAWAARIDERDFSRVIANIGHIDVGPFTTEGFAQNVAIPRSAMMSDADFIHSQYYNEVVRPIGGFRSIMAFEDRAGDSATLAFCRGPHQEDFDTVEFALLEEVLPHFTNAIAWHGRLNAAELRGANLGRAFDSLVTGIVILDAAARPLYINRSAMALTSDLDSLRLNAGRAAGANAAATKRLHALIAEVALAITPVKRRIRFQRRPPRLPLLGTVESMGQFGAQLMGSGVPSVALFLTEPDMRQEVDRASVADAFNLTRREADVAILLGQGLDLAQIAVRLELGIGTVRNHLKRVFSKTDAHTQRELAALLRGFSDPTL